MPQEVKCLADGLKSIFYKKILEKAVHPKNLQRTAPIFQANTHQNMGQSFANFLNEPLIQVFSYKKLTLVNREFYILQYSVVAVSGKWHQGQTAGRVIFFPCQKNYVLLLWLLLLYFWICGKAK